eukprot:614663-Prorocentrum_minimum.AAC.1
MQPLPPKGSTSSGISPATTRTRTASTGASSAAHNAGSLASARGAYVSPYSPRAASPYVTTPRQAPLASKPSPRAEGRPAPG